MNSHRTRLLALAVAAALHPLAGWAGASSTIPTYQAGAGVLSYTFFNLSGSDCTLTAHGSGGNPAAYSSWAVQNGWSNNGDAGFFNPVGLGGDSKKPSTQVTSNYLFYNNYDPIDTSSVPSAGITLLNGQGQLTNNSQVLITSGQLGPVSGNESINYPAMGDSWSIACQNGIPTIALANLASAASVLQSNGPTSYPYPNSQSGWFENASINPPAWGGCNSSTNPCGVGFTSSNPSPGNQILNWNTAATAANYQAMGGLWSGVNYNSTSCGSTMNCSASSYPGSNLLNMPMLPINMSAYVQASQGNFNPNDSSQHMYYTPIYGGHFTLAMGDPFVISSYAAKMLWYQVTSSKYLLSNDTTLTEIASNLSNTSGGVFQPGSFEDNYVQWLLGSQSSGQNYPGTPLLAAKAYQSAFKAASVPITHESVWGKVFQGLADTAIDIGVAATSALPGGAAVDAVAGGVAAAAGGAVVPDMNAAIANQFTSTISGPAPQSQAAPAVINPTYAATNLLGLMLTNTAVQLQINATLGFTGNPSPYYSNYSIATECTNLSLANNLMSGTCSNSSGSAVTNGPNNPATSISYTNVYATNQTTTQFSLWNAILTGSDVTTNASGYMVLGDSAGDIPSFSPPVQLINATNGSGSPTQALPGGVAVNTTFSLASGVLTATSLSGPTDPTFAGSTPVPAAAPSVTVVVTPPQTWNAQIPGPGWWSPPTYNASTGIFDMGTYLATTYSGNNTNITEYSFANGSQFINMTACGPNAGVTLTLTPNSGDPSNPYGASGQLKCTTSESLSGVTLSYSACTSDPWATGGVLAGVTSVPAGTGLGWAVTLACACVPAYLDGPQTSNASASQLLGGVVVGATSANPNQSCPTPSN